jgi:hypothetical protein
MAKEWVSPYIYAEIARSGYHWKLHAEAFRFSAKKLYEAVPIDDYGEQADVKTQCVTTYLFLIGLSIENLLKGLIVEAEPTLIIDTRHEPESADLHTYELHKSLKTHDLVTLADVAKRSKQCNLSFDGEENELLSRLSHFVQWQGRYPVALTSETQKSLYFRPAEDRTIFERLWERLSAALDEVIKKRKSS